MKRYIGIGGMAVLVATGIYVPSTVVADQAEKQISAWFNSITIKVNGEQVAAENFIYEGTTYVPLRAISELLGDEVKWDEHTRTVEINDMREAAESRHPAQAQSQQQGQTQAQDSITGNTAGNLANLGKLAGDEHWIYVSLQKHVSNGNPEDGLYKMKPDGSEPQKLTDHIPQYLNLDGETLYFADNGIYEMDVNGSKARKLHDTGDALMLAGEWLYVSDGDSGVYRMKKDGSDKQHIVGEGRLASVAGNALYYLKDNALFVTDLAQPGETKLFSIAAERHSIPIVRGKFIFYTDYKSVYRFNLDGTHQEILYTTDKDNLFSINVDGETLLVTDGNSGNHYDKNLIKISLNGGAPQHSNAGGLTLFTTPGHVYVTDFSAGYNQWFLWENGERTELSPEDAAV